MKSPRDLCVRKNITISRDIKRIPVIVDLIYNLWELYRISNPSTGFFYITNLLEIEADKKGEDAFFWEEDKWYDLISGEIEKAKKFVKNYEISDKDKQEMKDILQSFSKYWSYYSDLRFQQIINIFDEDFEEYVREYEGTCDSKFYQHFFSSRIKNKLENQLNNLKNRKEEIISGKDQLFNINSLEGEIVILKEKYVSKMNEFIKEIEKQLKEFTNG